MENFRPKNVGKQVNSFSFFWLDSKTFKQFFGWQTGHFHSFGMEKIAIANWNIFANFLFLLLLSVIKKKNIMNCVNVTCGQKRKKYSYIWHILKLNLRHFFSIVEKLGRIKNSDNWHKFWSQSQGNLVDNFRNIFGANFGANFMDNVVENF